MENPQARGGILVVDDAPENIDLIRNVLGEDYRLLVALSGEKALELVRTQTPDLVLLDVVMPGLDGYEVCRRLKLSPRSARLPVIFLTASNRAEDEERGLLEGAVDYITKPIHPPVLLARVRTHLALYNQAEHLEMLVRERTRELYDARLQIVQRLGVAAEFKDNETGMHVMRVGMNSELLGLAAGMSAPEAEILRHAAPMHDIGKIGIPDRILLKPGKLDEEEMRIIRTHTLIGARVLGDAPVEPLRMARQVALTHHEKWNGEGYPAGLAGEDIPLTGRIVAIADVFDALTSERPYKKAWPVQQAVGYIVEAKGTQFDPHLVDCFLRVLPQVSEICRAYQDPEEGGADGVPQMSSSANGEAEA